MASRTRRSATKARSSRNRASRALIPEVCQRTPPRNCADVGVQRMGTRKASTTRAAVGAHTPRQALVAGPPGGNGADPLWRARPCVGRVVVNEQEPPRRPSKDGLAYEE